MTKNQIIFKLQLTKGIKINLDIAKSEFPLFILTRLSQLTTLLYIFFIFSSFIFRFSAFSNLNTLIFSYIYIIVIGVLQFIRLILGGEEHLKKVSYDLLILTLPPVVIGVSLLNSGTDIDTFGKQNSWDFAPLSLLIGIIFAYLIGLNFSFKNGAKYLRMFFDLGLLVGTIIFLFSRDSFYFQNSVTFINYLALLLAPYYVLRFFSENSKWKKVLYSVILGSSIVLLFQEINEMYSLLNSNSFYRLYFKPQVILALIWYQIFAVGLLIGFLIKIKFKLVDYVKNINHQIDQSIKGNIKNDLRKLITAHLKTLFVLSMSLFSIITLSWLLVSNYLQNYIKTFFREWKILFEIDGIKALFLGNGLSSSYNHVLSIIESYGIIAFGIFLTVIFSIFYNQIKKIRSSKLEVLKQSRFHNIIGLISIVIFAFSFNITTLIFIVFWYFISQFLLYDREENSEVKRFQMIDFGSVGDKQIRILLLALRYILIVGIIIGSIFVIKAIFNGIDGGLFYTI